MLPLQPPLKPSVGAKPAAITSSAARGRRAVSLAASVELFPSPSTRPQTLWVRQQHDSRPTDGSKPLTVVFFSPCPGEPAFCYQDSASVTLVGCLLEDKGINLTALHLNDETCKGEVDPVNHTVTFSFNATEDCGADIRVGSLPSTSWKVSQNHQHQLIVIYGSVTVCQEDI